MAASYTVLPINKESRQWLESIDYPDQSLPNSRYPSPKEILLALSEKEEYLLEYHQDQGSTQITVTEKEKNGWASLVILKYTGSDEDLPHQFSFDNGWRDTILNIIGKIANYCGPLIVVNNANMIPMIINPPRTT